MPYRDANKKSVRIGTSPNAVTSRPAEKRGARITAAPPPTRTSAAKAASVAQFNTRKDRPTEVSAIAADIQAQTGVASTESRGRACLRVAVRYASLATIAM